MTALTKVSENQAFGGFHTQYKHQSVVNNCEMTFAIYLPPVVYNSQASAEVPVLYWLSGLTCNDQNFMQKAGALKAAADLGIAIVCPDTSPRGDGVPDDPEAAYDFGLGAGFYVNATESPWSEHYNMYDYIVKELVDLIEAQFPVSNKKAISGHSMGGHGALTIGLKHPDLFSSISAFAPIANPVNCPWGEKALANYLGQDKAEWRQYDASYLLSQYANHAPILVDQGSADDFLEEQLKPEALVKSAQLSNSEFTLNMRSGYDHSYFFISSFIDKHLAFHAEHFSD
ncbi:S-formylglutathione hydrolase [Glaciecola sp. MH2013]|uniref:S-formylglutathione hydrolase n=1 Tax=Glaciecola sp. MH2013 TaxID=2785524 RepID=UPI00189E6FC5|nr:S-formylglutathione hydrolase [Glaciecola sp. MH2013]MBF7074980.1 S-formylglutathione hydrolase [Glaciecola sp. MH2013]